MVQYDAEGATTIDNDTGEITPFTPTAGLQSIVTAEINQAIATARQFPRRRDKEVINEIMGRATLNEEIASECMYTTNRGGKDITGPSIRFAEIVRASYGNIRVATQYVGMDVVDPERAAVIVQSVALDLETNSSEVIPVRRSIMTSGKGGRKPTMYNADMTNMTISAAGSIARRNSILAVVPKALWIEGYQRVVKVLQGTVDTLVERRARLIEAFGKINVTPEMLFEAIGVKDASDIRVDHMPAMIGMMTAIKDGEAVDSVLGRMTPEAGAPRPKVDNPMQDKKPVIGSPEARAEADRVIEPDGTISKDSGDDADIILDLRQPEGKQRTTFAERRKAKLTVVKSDPITSGPQPGTAKQAASATAAADVARAQPAAAQAGLSSNDDAPDGYGDEASYLAWMRGQIKIHVAAKNSTALKDAWGKSRADRRELLGSTEVNTITNEYNAAQVALLQGDEQ